jgi:hypothetical protein
VTKQADFPLTPSYEAIILTYEEVYVWRKAMAEDNVNQSNQPPSAKPGENAKSSTTPIKPVGTPAASAGDKSTTSRINLSSAVTPTGGVPAPGRVPQSENPKKSTSRVNIPTNQITQSIPADKLEAIKKTTVRVQIEDIKKGDTQQIQAAKAATDAAKQKTSQINLNEVLGDDQDIFKRRTTLLDASKFPASQSPTSNIPRTIRIKQPDASQTSAIRKPTEEIPQVAPVSNASLETSKKSETARIELPAGVAAAEEIPPTRRKTIRIKRPENVGTGNSRPVVITQTTEVGVTPDVEAMSEEADEPGVVFVAMAAVASLVFIGLITVQVMALNSMGSY